jgi:hypothetical protein
MINILKYKNIIVKTNISVRLSCLYILYLRITRFYDTCIHTKLLTFFLCMPFIFVDFVSFKTQNCYILTKKIVIYNGELFCTTPNFDLFVIYLTGARISHRILQQMQQYQYHH